MNSIRLGPMGPLQAQKLIEDLKEIGASFEVVTESGNETPLVPSAYAMQINNSVIVLVNRDELSHLQPVINKHGFELNQPHSVHPEPDEFQKTVVDFPTRLTKLDRASGFFTILFIPMLILWVSTDLDKNWVFNLLFRTVFLVDIVLAGWKFLRSRRRR